jgi:7-cyano-7-deazaguanine synthase
LDSLALLLQLLRAGHRVLPVYVRFGLRWEAAERYWLHRQLRQVRQPRLDALHTVRLPVAALYGAHWSLQGRYVPSHRSRDAAVYLPGRNLLLLTAAGLVCAQQGIGTLAVGTLRSNPFGDASPGFFRAMGRCLTAAFQHPMRVIAPLRTMTKAQVLAAMPTLPVALTFSCLAPRGRRACGGCNKCAERARLA